MINLYCTSESVTIVLTWRNDTNKNTDNKSKKVKETSRKELKKQKRKNRGKNHRKVITVRNHEWRCTSISEVAHSSKTLETKYQWTWCHNTVDLGVHEHYSLRTATSQEDTHTHTRVWLTELATCMQNWPWSTETTCCPSELWMCSSPSLRLANAQFPTTSLVCPGRERTGWLGVLGFTCARARWSFSRNSPRFSVT